MRLGWFLCVVVCAGCAEFGSPAEFPDPIALDETPPRDRLSFHNLDNAYDVNASGEVSALDALLIINHLGDAGPGPMPPEAMAPPYLDVNADGVIEEADAQAVIDWLNTGNN